MKCMNHITDRTLHIIKFLLNQSCIDTWCFHLSPYLTAEPARKRTTLLRTDICDTSAAALLFSSFKGRVRAITGTGDLGPNVSRVSFNVKQGAKEKRLDER